MAWGGAHSEPETSHMLSPWVSRRFWEAQGKPPPSVLDLRTDVQRVSLAFVILLREAPVIKEMKMPEQTVLNF